MTIPDDIADEIDPCEVGVVGCLLPTGDAVNSGDDDE